MSKKTTKLPSKKQIIESVYMEFKNQPTKKLVRGDDYHRQHSLLNNIFRSLFALLGIFFHLKFTEKVKHLSFLEVYYIAFHSYNYSTHYSKIKNDNPFYHQHINYSYHQQPCTYETRRHRAAFIKKHTTVLDTPILLLGDDDLLCLELVEQGYTNITVIDIDNTLIDYIKQKNCREITAWCHDFNNPIPEYMIKSYSLVFVDPSYTADCVKLFINTAKSLCNKAFFTLMICLGYLYLTDDEIESLQLYFRDNNIQLQQFIIGFNLYDLTLTERCMKALLFLYLKIGGVSLKHSYTLAKKINHCVSDLLVCQLNNIPEHNF